MILIYARQTGHRKEAYHTDYTRKQNNEKNSFTFPTHGSFALHLQYNCENNAAVTTSSHPHSAQNFFLAQNNCYHATSTRFIGS